jgi:SdrD B-like domain
MPATLRNLAALTIGLAALAAPDGAAGAVGEAACGGRIFHDRDADGTRIEALDQDGKLDDVEPGVRGVAVTIVDAGTERHETRSAGDGTWSIDLRPSDYPIRIEFDPPAGYAPGRPGPDGGSRIQFADSPGDCDGLGVGGLGVYDLDAYCAEQPDLAVPCYVTADHPSYAETPAIYAISNAAIDGAGGSADEIDDWLRPVARPIATNGQIGTVYGLASARDGTLFAAGFTKRHTRLATSSNRRGNPTVIYRIPPGGEPEVFAVVDPTAVDPHDEVGADGDIGDDLDAMAAVFTTGLGDLEISPDGTTLYTVDLGRRQLVSLDTVSGRITARIPLDGAALGRTDCAVSPTNRFGDLRAFGLGWDHDQLLVGVVCSAQSTVTLGLPVGERGTPGPAGGDPGQLVGSVYRLDDGLLGEVVSWSLNADRGETHSNGLLSNKAMWHPWVDSYPFDKEHDAVSYPQPAITDIAVDERGNLMIALADRWSHQTAPESIAPSWDGRTRRITETIAAGDLQRACRRLLAWVIEGTNGCDGGFGNGWEFFDGDSYGWHAETALGSVVRLPGRSEVVATQMDPRIGDDTWRSGGLAWHTTAGEYAKGVRLYDGRSADPDHTFEEGSGVGDLALLCGGPPVQIGGAVWHDGDGDGLRDPGEVPVPGVALELRDHAGEVLSADITDARGAYSFDDGNVPGGLVDGGAYVVTVAARNHEPERGVLGGTGPFTGLVPTIADAGQRDDLDSDAAPGRAGTAYAELAAIELTAGDDPGTEVREPAVDHSYDIGLRDRYDLAITTSQGDRTREDGLVSFHIRIHNEGSLPSGPFQVRANLPVETSLRVTTPLVATLIDEGSVTWSFSELQSVAAGATRGFDMLLQVNDPTVESISNVVEIVSDGGVDEDSTPGRTLGEDDEDRLDIRLYNFGGSIWIDAGDETERVERGIGGVVVHVLDEAGDRVGGTTTDDEGRFLFDSFPAGSYRISIPASEFERGRPLHGYDGAVGATSGAVSRMIDSDGAVRSSAIALGGDRSDTQLPTIRVGLTRRPPRPLIDLVVPTVLLPILLLCVVALFLDRRRHLGGVVDVARAR